MVEFEGNVEWEYIRGFARLIAKVDSTRYKAVGVVGRKNGIWKVQAQQRGINMNWQYLENFHELDFFKGHNSFRSELTALRCAKTLAEMCAATFPNELSNRLSELERAVPVRCPWVDDALPFLQRDWKEIDWCEIEKGALCNAEPVEIRSDSVIEPNAYEGRGELVSVRIVGAKNIGVGAFAQCPNLEQVVICGGLDRIDRGAFFHCPKLRKVVVEGYVDVVESDAFQLCESLIEVDFNGGVGDLGHGPVGGTVFAYCHNLKIVRIGSTAGKRPANIWAFNLHVDGSPSPAIELSGPVTYAGFSGTAVESVAIGTGGDGDFEGCGCLRRVVLPEGLKVIRAACFAGCTSLMEIEIPHSVAQIEKSAFRNCENLERIVLKGCIEVIGPFAFKDCTSLKSIIVEHCNTGEVEIQEQAFKGCTSLETISLPQGVKVAESAFETIKE